MKKNPSQPSRKQLLKSPVRDYKDVDKEYDQILLVPAGTKHDSGYMHIAVIGVTDVQGGGETYEICAWPDDITIRFPFYDLGLGISAPKMLRGGLPQVRMDCIYPSAVLRYHGRGKFKVTEPLSSVEILFEERNP
jgi:hypothetical protein